MKCIEVLALNENCAYILSSEDYMNEGGNRMIKLGVSKDFTLVLGEVFKEEFEGGLRLNTRFFFGNIFYHLCQSG